MKRNRWWLHWIPLTIGFGLAFGGLPFYRNAVYACHIQNPPIEKTWYPLVFLTYIPIFLALIFTTAMMIRVYIKLRERTRHVAQWTFGSLRQRFQEKVVGERESDDTFRPSPIGGQRQSSNANTLSHGARQSRQSTHGALGKLERAVFVQSLFYLFAFYFCWVFLLAAHLTASPSLRDSLNLDHLYGYYVATFAIAPLQGFWNCCIYFRPRLWTRWSKRRSNRAQRSSTPTPAATPSAPSLFSSYFESRFSENTADNDHLEAERDSVRLQCNDSDDPSAMIAMFAPSSDASVSVLTNERSDSTLAVSAGAILAEAREELEVVEGTIT